MKFAWMLSGFGLLMQLFMPAAWSQSNSWEKTGLAEYIVAMTVDTNNHIYAGGNGVYRSADSGFSWTRVSQGLPNVLILSLDVSSNGYLFAGTFYAGVYRSIDRGGSWTQIHTGMRNVVDWAFNAHGDIFAVATVEGIFRSTDMGDTWMAINNGLTGNFSSVAINDNLVFVTNSSGIYRSADNGDNWVQINSGLATRNVMELAVTAGGHIFAGTYDGGIYRSNNNGDSWEQINNGLWSSDINGFAFGDKGKIFASTRETGVYCSLDNGGTWLQINRGLPTDQISSIAIDHNTRLFVSTLSNGVYQRAEVSSFAPLPPSLTSPLNNTVNISTSPTLKWNPASTATSYQLQIATTSSFTTTVIDQRGVIDTTYDVTGLSSGMTYYWRVNASNDEGTGPWSSPWSFSTVLLPPLLTSPPDGATNISLTPTLKWNAAAAAKSYRVQVAADSNFSTLFFDQSGITGTSFELMALLPGTTYFWRVRTTYTLGSSDWSVVWRFTTGTESFLGWVAQASGTANNLNSVCFVDAKTGWAVGDNGTILHTADGGSNWNQQNSGTTAHLKGVTFINAQIGVAVGESGSLLRTTNGGESWVKQTSGYSGKLAAVAFIHADTGFAVGGQTILRTLDGGATWQQQQVGMFLTNLKSVYFTDYSNGWVAGGYTYIRCTSWTDFFHSTDGGVSWAHPPGFPSGTLLTSISFPDATTGFAVGYEDIDCIAKPRIGRIWSTVDGSMTWAEQFRQREIVFNSVHFAEKDTGAVVGEAGTILHTTDGGTSWSPQLSGTTKNLNSVYFTDSQTGWVVGEGGIILHTINSGVTSVTERFDHHSPKPFFLHQNHPNPFNAGTEIYFQLPKADHAVLTIYSVLGQEIRRLAEAEFEAGYHSVRWDGRDNLGNPVPSGVYLYKLQAGPFSQIKKMTLLR